ncbi:orotate phosphoribosyltransferase [Bombiscardovia apis]|uniref:Orotate phosphoribosyltransferase n=1 Tax=Bombiscardovia apis TaxID=2932182 RepID=A0ABM8BES8_9BIFI|nr:orotate phosphoribosyltransferase [Bombiscardovia apis]BDR55304.1 orotate phosphoribosyltransferase [Bombiscardovia apis]
MGFEHDDTNTDDRAFRLTGSGELGGQRASGGQEMLEPREQLRGLLAREIDGRAFAELAGVSFDHRGAELAGHVLLDTLEEAGYSTDDFDAVGALTAAAVPLAGAMLHAAASRGQDLDAFVMDFVYPSIKGPSIEGKRVILLDAWLSEKSYVQTSSLVTLRNGNELSLDCGIVSRQGASVVAIASLVGGVGKSASDFESASDSDAESAEQTAPNAAQALSEGALHAAVEVIDPIDNTEQTLPFICAYDEELFAPASTSEGESHD